MTKSVNTAPVADTSAIDALTARCATAHTALVAKLKVNAERATLDRNALAAATVRIEHLEAALAKMQRMVGAMNLRLDKQGAESSRDIFMRGVRHLRVAAGFSEDDSTCTVDPVQARIIGQRLHDEELALRNASSVAPAPAPVIEADLPF